nr:hypothetical protein CFP56_53613 [Quercus suber]
MVCRMFRWDVPLRFCNNRYLHQTTRSCYGSDADAPRDLAEYSATSIVRHRNRENCSASDDLLLVLHCLFCCTVLIWLGTFNTYIIELIYGLPTFEQLDYDGPPHLTWDIRMSKSMVAGLIHYKMKSEPHTRPLTSEIRETLQLIESIPGLGDTTGYNEALVQLAAEALPLSEVIGRLSARSYKTAHRSSILENALIAALYQNQISHIETILACGAQPHRRTYSFGEPIAVAACYAGLDSLYLVVQKASLLKDELCDKLVASRLLAALEKAAGKGRSDIFAKGMPVLIDIVGPGEPRYLFYTTALSSAILAGHGHVVDTITDILNKDDYLFTSRDDHASWLQLARLASSENYEDVLALAIKFSSKADLLHEMEKLLGDACRQGHVNIVDMLMTNVEPHLDWYTNAVYWAARNAHWKVLAHLNSRDPRVGSQCITTALCGASMCGKSGTTQVLRTIDTWHKLTEAVENFDGAYFSVIDELLKDRDQTELLSRHISVTSRQLRLKEQEAYVDQWWPPPNLPLRKACASGDISFVHDEIKNDPSQGAGISTRYVGCFSTAIEFNHPGILLYLCQKMSHSRSFNYGPALRAKSIAIFQVMLDTGWDIDEVQSKIHSSSLGSVCLRPV